MAQFLSNLPIGATIKFGKHQVGSETAQSIVWVVADKNHSGYPSNSVTLITQKIIDLRAFDGKETNYANGNPNYALSNINQWLNSSASAGKWYTAKHSNDAPPANANITRSTGYDTRPGFLYNFTEFERLSILPTTLTNQVEGDISGKITTNVFLPSSWEVMGTGYFADGSSRLAYFASNSAAVVLTNQAYSNTSATSKPTTVNNKWYYYTRNNASSTIAYVLEDGTMNSTYPYEGYVGIRPVVNLSNTVKISDSTDSDGCYTVIANSYPTITGSNGNLGIKGNYYTEEGGFPTTLGFVQTYTVGDADNEPVTVKEYIDNVLVRSYVATSGATNTFAVTGNTWLKLANGTHTLKITATDGFAESTRTYTFTKSVGLFVAQRTTPIEASTMPTHIVVTVAKNIPDGATLKVEACNNGFDAHSTWEEVEPGEIHKFVNTSKTATKWGVNIRVTVDRNGSEGACYITEIGGNFK